MAELVIRLTKPRYTKQQVAVLVERVILAVPKYKKIYIQPPAFKLWSRKYTRCRNCHSTERHHYAKGYCAGCASKTPSYQRRLVIERLRTAQYNTLLPSEKHQILEDARKAIMEEVEP